jgi:hypothetical protein
VKGKTIKTKHNRQKTMKKSECHFFRHGKSTYGRGSILELIDKSRVAANNNYQAQIASLKAILLTLEPSDIVKFDNTFTALLAASYDYKLWGASFVINGGCSDDCFDYFRQYLIGHGKKILQDYQRP